MAFPNKPHRRINYTYLAKLRDALENLGHQIEDVPVMILRSPWPEIKIYLEDNLRLRVCSWCKLPLPPDQMSETSLCLVHAESLQQTHENRRLGGRQVYSQVGKHKRMTPIVQAMQKVLRDGPDSQPETDIVGASIPELPSDPFALPESQSTAWDILGRADVRRKP